MGGDAPPSAVVNAISSVSSKGVKYLLYGDGDLLSRLVAESGIGDFAEVRPSDSVIPADLSPREVLRWKGSSMSMAVDSLSSREAAAVISRGNTGALLALAKRGVGMESGLDRPAIAAWIPTIKSDDSLMLDLGANVTCTSENLVGFAKMGLSHAEVIKGRKCSVALLNIGSEASKGTQEIQDAYRMLQESIPDNFVGFIEGNQILDSVVDVIVTDGFSGNIALKVGEGMARAIASIMREYFRGSLRGKVAAMMSMPALRRLKEFLDPDQRNGAVLLGLDGLVFKIHGSADERGITCGIERVVQEVKRL